MKKFFVVPVISMLMLALVMITPKGNSAGSAPLAAIGCTRLVHDTTRIHDTTVVHDSTVKNMAFAGLRSGFQWADVYSIPVPNPDSSAADLSWSGNSHMLSQKHLGQGYLYFADTLYLVPDLVYRMRITSRAGACSSTVTLPESSYFTQPRQEETLPARTAATVSWAVAPNADFYEFYCYVYGYDSLWNSVYNVGFETFTRSTSYIIPASYFSTPSAVYFDVQVDVRPYNGVFPEANAIGNMAGALAGFLTAEGPAAYCDFYVGTPPGERDFRRHTRSAEDAAASYRKAVLGK